MIPVDAHRDRAGLAEALADEVAAALSAALAARGRASIAVAGGGTPGPFLTALGRRALDWPRVTVMPTDERWAPPDDARSNDRLIRATLCAGAARPALIAFWRAGEAPAAAAPAVAAAVAPHLPLDVCVLGMGADMHCASLFPGGAGLAEMLAPGAAPAVGAITAPGAPEPRLTLSADALAGASLLRLLITGEEKRAVLQTALKTEDEEAAPVAAVLRRARDARVCWAP